jgi:hypothetical protein
MIDRLLDGMARRANLISLFFVGIGVLVCAFYWYVLTTRTFDPADAFWYWNADPSNLYPHPELLERNGYNYSPAFELVVGWGRLFDFPVFVAIWRAILLGTLVWLAGPFAFLVLFTVPVASEINAGNIQMLLAAAIVLSFRKSPWWGATWAFVLLTKVTPGVGLLWFAARRQWRRLAIAVGVTCFIAAVTFVLWPDRWVDWVLLLTSGSPPPVPPYYLPFLPRFLVAIVVVLVAAWRGWRWPLIVAATLALPAFYALSPSLLVGVLPFLRESLGRWTERRLARAGPLTPS